MDYKNSCEGCRISQDLKTPPGGIVKLPGNWIVNQYGGDEGYLGWLALQPRFHRMELSHLTVDEAQALGPNILKLDACLKQYWHIQSPKDPILRVYAVYFFESALKKNPDHFHFHIHLIPRFRSLEKKKKLLVKDKKEPQVDGWKVPKFQKYVPKPYRRNFPNWENRTSALMSYLRHELSTRP